MIITEDKNLVQDFEEKMVDLASQVSESQLQAYQTSEGIQFLSEKAFGKILDDIKNKFKPLKEVYFIYNNEITEGVIRKVSTETSFDASGVVVKTNIQIAMSDGTILSYPGEIEKFVYKKEDLIDS